MSGCGERVRRAKAHRDYLLGLVKATPDLTISELLERLLAERGVQARRATLWPFLDRCGLTLKRTAHASEQNRPDIVKRRQDWFDGQLDLDPERLVLIDETWATTNMTR